MSKAAKKGILILMVLLVFTLGFAVKLFVDLTNTEKERLRVVTEFEDAKMLFKDKERINQQKEAKLNEEIEVINDQKAKALLRIKETEKKAGEEALKLTAQISEITDDRDKWKRRIDTIKDERDKLITRITELSKELEDKEKEAAEQLAKVQEPQEPLEPVDITTAPKVSPVSGGIVDEQYWANLLKDKASLEVDVQSLKDELSSRSIELVEIRQSAENMEIQVETLKRDKEDVMAELQHKTDMIDNISLELARTKNDKKFITNRVEKLNSENSELRGQMKQLISVKNALEKTIVRITQEKDRIENDLGKTETLIQSKIDEIWDIKDELDHSIKTSQAGAASNEVELPPIVVSSSNDPIGFSTGQASPTLNGKVISVNESNNFVIVDLGENSGVRLGDNLSVYRDSKYIARLEVIQVRKDISAADLKDQWSKIKIGDVIR